MKYWPLNVEFTVRLAYQRAQTQKLSHSLDVTRTFLYFFEDI